MGLVINGQKSMWLSINHVLQLPLKFCLSAIFCTFNRFCNCHLLECQQTCNLSYKITDPDVTEAISSLIVPTKKLVMREKKLKHFAALFSCSNALQSILRRHSWVCRKVCIVSRGRPGNIICLMIDHIE